ncbi:hypothetical protein PC116_g31921 [Phytophthora cactorum]|nr:hypothetical protein PC116_g31921 [Phytophthora cactorum]
MDNIGRCGLNTDCPTAGLHAQTPDQYSSCTKEQQAPEEVDGCKFSPYLVFSLKSTEKDYNQTRNCS